MTSAPNRFRPAMALWLVWNCAIVVLLVSTAFTRYPGLHHDSALYATPIVTVAATGAWEIDSFVPSLISESGARFDRHGQLYQWLLGRVLHCSSYETLFVWISVLNTLTFVFMLLLALRMLSDCRAPCAPWLASGIAAMTALICLWVQGRPEHLIPLLMAIPFAAREWSVTAPHARRIGYGILGLVVVTSPFPGLLCCLGVVAWIGLRHREHFISEVAVCAAISMTAAITILLIACPVNPWQWVLNTSQASGATPSNLGAFFTHLTDDLPLWNLIVLGSMLLLAIGLVRRRMAWLGLIHAAVFISLLWKLQVYVMAGFVPSIMLALASRHRDALGLPRLLAYVPHLMVGIVSVTSLITLARSALLATVFVRQGASFAQTSAAVNELQAGLGMNERIGFLWLARPSFVVFGNPGHALISIEPDALQNQPDTYLQAYEAQQQCKVRYLLLPQHGYLIPRSPPPLMGGGVFSLVKAGWTTRPAMLGGISLADTLPGYQFALYRRVD